MVHPGYPPPRLPKPPVATADLWVCVGALIVTVAFGVLAAAMGLFSLAFLDYCPPESCSAEGAATAAGRALLAAFAIGVVGLVVTVVQLYRRKPGWPFGVATFVLCAVVLGGVGYAIAVGARPPVGRNQPLGRASSPTVAKVEPDHRKAPELVPVEALRSGEHVTDVNGGGQHYIVLESKVLGGGCVVLELESKANDQLRVIEMSFPAGYEMGRSPRRVL
jgi:hypothetical protein